MSLHCRKSCICMVVQGEQIKECISFNWLKRIVHDYKDTDYTIFPSELKIEPQIKNKLRILIYNLWAIPPVCPNIEHRLLSAMEYMSSQDIIIYQEAFHRRERRWLIEAAKRCGLIYSHDFCNGIGLPLWPGGGGTGLLVLSRYPIVESMYKRYSCNGNPTKIYHGDYLVAKGVGLVRIFIDVEQTGIETSDNVIDVYFTHMHASYDGVWPPRPNSDEYYGHRIAQSFECAQFVKATRKSTLVILAGDFNGETTSLGIRLQFSMISYLRDSYHDSCYINNLHDGIDKGYTYNHNTNKWVDSTTNPMATRIDFIFYSNMKNEYNNIIKSRWRLVESTLQDHRTDDNMPVSDHYGVQAVFEWNNLNKNDDDIKKKNNNNQHNILNNVNNLNDNNDRTCLKDTAYILGLFAHSTAKKRKKYNYLSLFILSLWFLIFYFHNNMNVNNYILAFTDKLMLFFGGLLLFTGTVIFIRSHFGLKEDMHNLKMLQQQAILLINNQ